MNESFSNRPNTPITIACLPQFISTDYVLKLTDQNIENIKEVDKFVYQGSVSTKDGETDKDIKSWIYKAKHAFNTLQLIWRSTGFSLRNKIRIFNTNVKSVLLYGSHMWRMTKTSTQKLQTYTNRCLRNILNIRWPMKIYGT